MIFLAGSVSADVFTESKIRLNFVNGSKSNIRSLSVSVFSPRVVGYAIARYDFCSRDTRELSLQQGDVITIYTKMPNGWWKGVVGGRVCL